MSEYAPVPATLAFDKRLSDGDIRLAIAIWSECWQGDDFDWSPPTTLSTLARSFELDRRTIASRLRRLADTGYIILELEEAGRSVVTRYRPHPDHAQYVAKMLDGGIVSRPEDVGASSPEPEHHPKNRRKTIPRPAIMRHSTTTTLSSLDSEEGSSSKSGNLATNHAILRHEQKAVADYLSDKGIRAPTNVRLAVMEHVTLAYAQAHIEAGERQGAPLRLVIHRMRSGDPAPDAQPDACPVCGGAGKHLAVFDPNDCGILMMCPATVLHSDAAFAEYGRLTSEREAGGRGRQG